MYDIGWNLKNCVILPHWSYKICKKTSAALQYRCFGLIEKTTARRLGAGFPFIDSHGPSCSGYPPSKVPSPRSFVIPTDKPQSKRHSLFTRLRGDIHHSKQHTSTTRAHSMSAGLMKTRHSFMTPSLQYHPLNRGRREILPFWTSEGPFRFVRHRKYESPGWVSVTPYNFSVGI